MRWAVLLWVWALVALAACSPVPLSAELSWVGAGLAVSASQPLDRVEVVDAAGVPLVRQRLPAPVADVVVEVPWSGATPYRVVLVAGSQQAVHSLAEGPILGPFEAVLQAPVGQQGAPLQDGARVGVAVVGQAVVQAALLVRIAQPGPVTLRLGDQELVRTGTATGERLVLLAPIDGALAGVVEHPDGVVRFTVVPERQPIDQVRQTVVLEEVAFPAEGSGRADPARAAGRITLPSDWWREVLHRTSLGFRPRDEEIPWAWQGLTLRNDGPVGLNLLVRSRVVGPDGAPDPAFRPKVREQDDGTGHTSALLRVPAGRSAVAALPVYVDDTLLGPGPWTREVEVWPLGSTERLIAWEAPLYVSRGSRLLGAGFGLGLTMALGGAVLLWRRLRVWLVAIPTSQLMIVALFGSLSFMVAAVGRLFGVSLASVLGPFSPLLTGIVDDAFRVTLLATLVSLCPRPGIAALAVLVEWLLGGLTLGAVSPVDWIFLCARVAWLEGALRLAGITGGTAWLDEGPWRQWARLALGLGVGGLCASATALAMHMVLYRLFYADWYVAMVLALPGFLYVLVACAIAVPFARSLRQVAP